MLFRSWVVDLGPEGGDGGGRVIAEGTPEQIALIEESHTGRFLAPVLARSARSPGRPTGISPTKVAAARAISKPVVPKKAAAKETMARKVPAKATVAKKTLRVPRSKG